MLILHIVLLSIVEGLTEFLPISSTGHLILTSKLLGIGVSEFTKTFEIAIQLGAILSIVVLYFKRFLNPKLYIKLLVAFVPTAIVGFTLYPLIKGYLLASPGVTLTSLFLGGVFLIFFDKSGGKGDINLKQAFLIGLFQSISVIPGVSRAAATIVGGMSVGLDRKSATEFSFLLAVPTMFGATTYDLYKSASLFTRSDFGALSIGFVLSFIFALLAVRFLISYVKNHNFRVFGVYRVVLSLVYWLFV